MPVERVDFYSDDEFEQALQQEAQEAQEGQYPEVVPCFVCGEQMYEISDNPEDNICESCNNPASVDIAASK